MSAPVSVIIPTLNAASQIGPTLAALSEGLTEGLIRELILADGGSADGIDEIAESVGAELVQAQAGRGTQLAAAADRARGAWLLILHADSVPEPGWHRAVRAHITDHPGSAAYFDLKFDMAGLAPAIVAGWANLRARRLALPYGDQGLLVPRGLYDTCGGYPRIALMEDVALVRALGRRRLRPLGHRITTSAARYRQGGWLRRGARNLGTLALYLLGRDPDQLARRYQR